MRLIILSIGQNLKKHQEIVMINLYEKSKEIESPEERGKAIQQLSENNLDLEKWKFRLSYQDFSRLFNSTRII